MRWSTIPILTLAVVLAGTVPERAQAQLPDPGMQVDLTNTLSPTTPQVTPSGLRKSFWGSVITRAVFVMSTCIPGSGNCACARSGAAPASTTARVRIGMVLQRIVLPPVRDEGVRESRSLSPTVSGNMPTRPPVPARAVSAECALRENRCARPVFPIPYGLGRTVVTPLRAVPLEGEIL